MKLKTLLTLIPCISVPVAWMNAQITLADEKVIVANERRVNSDEFEFSPSFYKDGIVFISSRFETVNMNVKDKNIGGKNIFSIYRSQRDGEGFLQEPTPFAPELTFRSHEGPLTFDRTAQTVYFTKNEPRHVAPDGFKKLQIYKALHNGTQWDSLAKLPFNNPDFNFLHPTISPDNDRMIFASDLPGGYGGMDLYEMKMKNGTWSEMVNLGAAVNTSGDDVFPYLAADGTLYFSSDGHSGYGGLDLLFSSRRLGNWTAPVNLGVPFNSPADDFGFIVDRDNKNGYFSSSRKGGFGEDDIYSFYVEGSSQAIAGGGGRGLEDFVVKDNLGNPLSGASVKAINMDEVAIATEDDGIVRLYPVDDDPQRFVLDVTPDNLGNEGTTNSDGKTDLALGPGQYVVKVSKDGYLPEYIVVGPDTDLSSMDLRLKPAANCTRVTGYVLMNNGRTAVSAAKVLIRDVTSRQSLEVYTDEQGFFEYCLPCSRDYVLFASRNGIMSEPGTISMAEIPCVANDVVDRTLLIHGASLYAGMTIVLPNIYFNFDDDQLRPDAYKDLDEVLAMLKSFPGMRLELSSHTDARGEMAYNLDLSQRRSRSVLNYLVNNGIEDRRLRAHGYGESELRNRCSDGVACSEAEHQYNRRTEIKIIEMGQAPATQPGIAVQFDEEIDANTGKGGSQEPVVVPAVESLPGVVEEADSPSGTYAVIAGTFANFENAARRVSQLQTLGFATAQIVKQQRNGLYAVWAANSDDRSAAFAQVRKLAQSQVSAYVKKR